MTSEARTPRTDEWGDDIGVAEWLVWYARRVDGKARNVAKQAIDENPALRVTERLAARDAQLAALVEGLPGQQITQFYTEHDSISRKAVLALLGKQP